MLTKPPQLSFFLLRELENARKRVKELEKTILMHSFDPKILTQKSYGISDGSSSTVFTLKPSQVLDEKKSFGSEYNDTSYFSQKQGNKTQIEDNRVDSTLAFDLLNAGTWEWDIANDSVICSKNWEMLFGKKWEYEGSPLTALEKYISPEDSLVLHRSLESLMQRLTNRLRLTVRVAKKNFNTWLELRFKTVCSPAGKLEKIFLVYMDITKQRNTEIALIETSEKYRIGGEDSPDFIVRFDQNGQFLYSSPNISHYFPIDPEYIVGQHFYSVFQSSDSLFFLDNLQHTFESGIYIEAETMLNSPYLGEFVAECRFWPEISIDGDVSAVTVQVRDMTTLHRMTENYLALFRSMVDGLALFKYNTTSSGNSSKKSKVTFFLMSMNPALARMLRIDPGHAIGKDVESIMGKDSEQWLECMHKALQYKKPMSFQLRSKEIPLIFDIAISFPGLGRLACIVKDMTEIQAIEQSIHLNESRFASLYRLSNMYAAPDEEVIQFSLDEAVKLTGSSFGYLRLQCPSFEKNQTFWTKEIISCYGEKTEEIIDSITHWFQQDSGDIKKAKIVNEPLNKEKKGSNELSIKNFMIAPVVEDDRVVCLAGVVNKDNDYEQSDLRQLELFINGMWFQLRRRWVVESLKQAKEQAETASRAKNIFLANVSHELRTPLNGILGMLELLQQSSLSPEQSRWVTIADYSGKILLHLISDILDFSRIEAGQYKVDPHNFDFAETIASTLGMFVPQAKQTGIDFLVKIDPAIPRNLIGDDAFVRQIIMNIVGNAFKFTPKGKLVVECSLLPICKKDSVRILISVEDTGIGIAEKDIPIIFHPFTQLDESNTRKYSGVGLGLSIVQRLIGVMGGSLCMVSLPGKGTNFFISLPFSLPSSDICSTISADPVNIYTPKLDILVAEDDPINRLTIYTMLQKAGHSILCVNNGREAIEALQLHRFDCFITDIQMPEMDGTEVVQRIRTKKYQDILPSEKIIELVKTHRNEANIIPIPKDIQVIALTAHAMTTAKEKYLALGMDYYLSKPISIKELKKTLEIIAKKQKKVEN